MMFIQNMFVLVSYSCLRVSKVTNVSNSSNATIRPPNAQVQATYAGSFWQQSASMFSSGS